MSASAFFAFSSLAHLMCAAGARHKLEPHLRQHYPSIKRLLLLTDAVLLGSWIAAWPTRRGPIYRATIFHRSFLAVADPPEARVLQARPLSQQQDSELIVGVGGGRSMDGAKLVLMLTRGQALPAMYGTN